MVRIRAEQTTTITTDGEKGTITETSTVNGRTSRSKRHLTNSEAANLRRLGHVITERLKRWFATSS